MASIKIPVRKRYFETRLQNLQQWEVPSIELDHVRRFVDELARGKVNRGRQLNQRTCSKYLELLRGPFEFFGKPIDEVELVDVERYDHALSTGEILSRRGLPYSQFSRADIRKAMQVYFRWRLGTAQADHLAGWLDTRSIQKTPEYLSEGEVEKLYRHCRSPGERFLIAVLFDSGARAEEFCNIRFEDIQLPTGTTNHVKLTLKEEYSKTKGRVIGLYWRHSLEAVSEFLKQRQAQGIRSDEPVFDRGYDASRQFLRRFGKRVLDKAVYYHLFRHSSATHYAKSLSRYQLCYRFGWRYASGMPDTYISRAGMEEQELSEKFTQTDLGELKTQLQRQQQQNQMKEDELKRLQGQMDALTQNYTQITELLQRGATATAIESELIRRKRK